MTEAKKLFLVFRENELFGLYIPKMEQILTRLGCAVETKKFSEGVPKTEIRKWLQENPKPEANVLLIDDTCYGAHPNYLYNFVGTKVIIDAIFDFDCPKIILFGEENFSKYFYREDKKEWLDVDAIGESENFENYECVRGKMFTLLVTRVLERHENMPKNIFISMDKILDHYPLALSVFEEGELSSSNYDELRIRGENPTLKCKERAAGKLRDWLVKAGIPREIIKIISGGLSKDEDQSNSWFIVDRHSNESPRFAKRFRVPLGNLIEDFKKGKMFAIGQDETEISLEKICKILFRS